tara:strand:+ start:779 stop:1267 length:489 start_codon:yes stop_codon:yes gene_type:complete
MTNSIQNLSLLSALCSGNKAPSRLTPAQAVSLTQAGFIGLAKGRVVVTPKGERAIARAAKKIRQERVTGTVAVFLGDFMKPGVGYSVKPQGKSKGRSILPWLQAKSDITRDECLNALRALRELGKLETNAHEVRNNCQIRWFLAGTREEAPAQDETVAAAAK